MNYTITAEIGGLISFSSNNGLLKKKSTWLNEAYAKGWEWVEEVGEEEPYQSFQLKTSDLKVVGENTLKLFESRIEAEATDEAGEKVGAVWKDPTQEIEWNYFYDNGG